MNIYLLGYRNGVNDYSWDMSLYFKKMPPLNTKLQRKDCMELGYEPFMGIGPKEIEACDYYIAHKLGSAR